MSTINLGYPNFQVQDSRTDKLWCVPWFFGESDTHIRPEFNLEEYRKLELNNFKATSETPLDPYYMLENLGLSRYQDRFSAKPYSEWVKEGKFFWIPIECSYNAGGQYEEMKNHLENNRLPEDVIALVNKGRAKVLIFSFWEGFIEGTVFKSIEQFSLNHGFSRGDVWVTSSNLRTEEIPPLQERHFSVKVVNHFAEDLWFRNDTKANDSEARETIKKFYISNRLHPKPYYFLCLNRRWDNHRAFMVGFLKGTPEIANKALVSLGTGNYDPNFLGTGKDASEAASAMQESINLPTVLNYYRPLWNKPALLSVDMPDDPRIARNRVDLNEDLYRSTYINLLTETHYLTRGVQFFSEKTFKSIYCLQPFILIATAGSLEKLRRLGFKTFDRWWSEDYDTIEDDSQRIDAVCEVVRSLAKKSSKEMFEIIQDMNEVLYYNAQLLMSSHDIYSLLDFLELENRVVLSTKNLV